MKSIKTTRYTLGEAAKAFGITWGGVRKMIVREVLEEAQDVRGIRTVTAKSLHAELKRRGLPIPNGESASDA